MSISETKKGEEKAAAGKSTEVNVTADIEESLSFLGSEEYQDVREPFPAKDSPTSRIHTAQPPQQKSSTVIKPQPKKRPHPSPTGKVPTKKGPAPVKVEKSKKSGKIWLLILSIAGLIVLAILFLCTMG
jgi:hypothetical protein